MFCLGLLDASTLNQAPFRFIMRTCSLVLSGDLPSISGLSGHPYPQ